MISGLVIGLLFFAGCYALEQPEAGAAAGILLGVIVWRDPGPWHWGPRS